jgi:hypothetical protein
MAFDLPTWQGRVREQLTGWRERMQHAGVTSIYHFLSAATLWPVVQAAQGGDWGAVGALGVVVAGVGSNLVADRIRGWKDEADGARQLAADLAEKPVLREELDVILQAVETLARAKEALPEADRQWFVETLQAELKQLERTGTFNIHVSGSGAVATDGGVAAGAGGVAVKGDVYGGVVIGGTPKKE